MHDLFQQTLGAVDEGRSLPMHPGLEAATLPAAAPCSSSQGITHCMVQPSQRLLTRCHRSEPADNRGRALSSASGTNLLPQPRLKLMLGVKSGHTVPSQEQSSSGSQGARMSQRHEGYKWLWQHKRTMALKAAEPDAS